MFKMKKSTWLLSAMTLVLISGIVTTNLLLKAAYLRIDVNNPFKNYTDIAVQPFSFLNIKGGNSYAIHLRHADSFNVKVMNSRKGFLETFASGDTLSVVFTVPGGSKSTEVENLPIGLIVYVPILERLQCAGTSVVLDSVQTDSLQINLISNAAVAVNHSSMKQLGVEACNNSWLLFNDGNKTGRLTVNISDEATVSMKGIQFESFSQALRDNGKLIFYKASMNSFAK
jgi:hypothetical protein